MCYVKHTPIVEVDSHIYQTNIPNKASDLTGDHVWQLGPHRPRPLAHPGPGSLGGAAHGQLAPGGAWPFPVHHQQCHLPQALTIVINIIRKKTYKLPCLTVRIRTGASELDPDLWETGLRQIVYREPNLRTAVNLAKEPVCWRPARDFSGVFRFTDLREKGCEKLEAGHDTVHIEIRN